MTTLNFRYPFRKYQRMILAQVEQAPKDHKYHIVAPPFGSAMDVLNAAANTAENILVGIPASCCSAAKRAAL